MRLFVALLVLSSPASAGAAPAPAKPPYWASIRAREARMRTGPARTFPASWLYRRADLPVRVVQVFKEWRRVEDPDGTSGWMQGNLLSDARTAIVRGPTPVAMLDRPVAGARLLWRAAPGVVGRLSACTQGWCRFDVHGQAGFVELGGLWGVEPGEVIP